MTTTPFRQQATDALHYYVVADRTGRPEGFLVEEFQYAADHSTDGLLSAGWSRSDPRWRDAAATSRQLRLDASLRARVAPADRAEVSALHRFLCGAGLPAEATLRACFGARPAPSPRPLRLSRPGPTPGFRETRVYRILFANELTEVGLDALGETWQIPVAGARTIPEVHRRIAGDAFRWVLHRVAAGAAWALDMTCDLAGEQDEAVGVLLRALTTQTRQQGLIPITIDRFR